MFPIVEIPEIVRHYESFFSPVFSPKALEQFKRYVSGLILSDNKTVEGINRLFVFDVRNQSSLNRLLTESPFSVEKLHQARLTLLSSVPGTQMKRKGVLSIDDTLLTHYGQQFEKIAPLFYESDCQEHTSPFLMTQSFFSGQSALISSPELTFCGASVGGTVFFRIVPLSP